MKVWVAKDEWYPYFSLSLTGEEKWRAKEIDLPSEEYERFIRADQEFQKCHEIIEKYLK